MCLVKTPKVKDPEKEKQLGVLRNPLLDGLLGNIASIRNGRNSLRINLVNPLGIPVAGGSAGGGGGGDTGGGTGGGSTGGGGSVSGSGGFNSPSTSESSLAGGRGGGGINER